MSEFMILLTSFDPHELRQMMQVGWELLYPTCILQYQGLYEVLRCVFCIRLNLVCILTAEPASPGSPGGPVKPCGPCRD